MREGPGGRPSRTRRPGAEELRLWRLATRDVAPLKGKPPPPDPVTPVPAAAPPPAAPLPPPPQPVPPRSRPPRPELKSGVVADLDRATGERLRRGEIPIDGRLDLHGLTQAQAHEALDRFLASAAALGRRCVLVITGKGWRPEEKAGGILRDRLPVWLNLRPNRERVLAFAVAQPRHGGSGAYYILLKRRRDSPKS